MLVGCHFETRRPIWNRRADHGEWVRRRNVTEDVFVQGVTRNQGLVVLEFGGHPIGLFPQMNYLSGEHTLKETL